MSKHQKDCNCEYKATHNYCPHPEHTCTCKSGLVMDNFDERVVEILGKWLVGFYTKDNALAAIKSEMVEEIKGMKKQPYKTTESRYGQNITIPLGDAEKEYNQAIDDIIKKIGGC